MDQKNNIKELSELIINCPKDERIVAINKMLDDLEHDFTTNRKNTIKQAIIVPIIAFLFIVFLFLGITIGWKQGYMNATQDFYKGKLKVELVSNADGTRTYQWNNKKDKFFGYWIWQ